MNNTLHWNETPEGLMAILHESFYPVGDTSSFPEARIERLVQDRQEMVTNHLTDQREIWLMPFVVELQVAGGKPVAKGVFGATQDNGRVFYLYNAVLCHWTISASKVRRFYQATPALEQFHFTTGSQYSPALSSK